jgi:hypothetical protein
MKWMIYKRSKLTFHLICELSGKLTLSEDKFARSKYGMLYVEPKVRLSRAGDNDHSLKLRGDCAVWFVSQPVVEGVKKIGISKASC